MIDHRAALVALLETDTRLSVFDDPPAPGTFREPPYVVAYLYVPLESRTKLVGPTDRTELKAVTHSVGASVEAAEIVARNVRDTLLDQALTVAGWRCTRLEHTLGRPSEWDQTTGTTLAVHVDEWDYVAQPAS